MSQHLESQENLSQTFDRKLSGILEERKEISRIVIALSGGVDSSVLLKLADSFIRKNKEGFKNLDLVAFHVNHGISEFADQWQEQCVLMCKSLACDFYSEVIYLEGDNNLEAQARELRYQCLENFCNPDDLLLTGHHSNDQMETILFRLFRGSGLDGLSGMPERRKIGQAILFRPLLGIRKKELISFASDNNLSWIEDDSNRDDYFSRNFIRSKLAPLIEQRWPDIVEKISKTSRLLSEQKQLLEDFAEDDLGRVKSLDLELLRWGECISLDKLNNFSEARKKNVLRWWLKKYDLNMPSEKLLNEILVQSGGDKGEPAGQVSWKDHDRNVFWRIFESHLFLAVEAPDESLKGDRQMVWNTSTNKEFSFMGKCFSRVQSAGVGIRAEIDILGVSCRQGGERSQPVGRQHSQTVKRLLQEYRVPPWERDRIPVFFYQDRIVAVADLWIDEAFASSESGSWELKRVKT